MVQRISTTKASAHASATIGNTAVPIEDASLFTALQLSTAERARITCLTQPIAFRYDGGTVTANGHYMAVGAEVEIIGNVNIKNLQFIRASGSDGRVTITLESF